nr:MMPL family transporter [Mycobacterium lentiflavum]
MPARNDPEGISHVDPIKLAAKEAIKGTPLEGSKIWLGGTAAVYKDMRDGPKYDLMIAGISAASLILIIMLCPATANHSTGRRPRRIGSRRTTDGLQRYHLGQHVVGLLH